MRRVMLLTIALISVMLLVGCRSYVPVVRERVEYKERSVHDTVASIDTVWIRTSGDTVYRDRVRWRYRSINKVDTLYRAKSDTVRVRADLTDWQKARLRAADVILAAVVGAIVLNLAVRLLRR